MTFWFDQNINVIWWEVRSIFTVHLEQLIWWFDDCWFTS